MGLCASSAQPNDGEGAEHGNDVDMALLQEQIQELFNFKILLLGAGESGKSTIVKQLKVVHKEKIREDELDLVAISLHQNVVDCTVALIKACEKFGLPLTHEEAQLYEELLEQDDQKRLTPEQGQTIVRVFNGETLQAAYERRHEFWILDSYMYYITHLERFCEPGFVPNEDDCVMARIRTTGIVVTDLVQRLPKPKPGTPGEAETPDRLQFKIVDVGGQRTERKKWIHCFDDVKAILFVVSLVGYNQVLFEDGGKNRMKEALELFSSVVGNKLFADTPIFLFLNKKDLFEDMIRRQNLKVCFGDYKGDGSVDDSIAFIQEKFRSRLPPEKTGVQILCTTSTSKRDIKMAFEEVKKRLYENNKNALFEQVRNYKGEYAHLHVKKEGKKNV